MKVEEDHPSSSCLSSHAKMENEIGVCEEVDDNGAPKTDSRPSKQTNPKKQKKSMGKNRTEGTSDVKTDNDTTRTSSNNPQHKPNASAAADHNFFEENSAADAAKANEESNSPRKSSDATANDTVAARANRPGSPLSSLSQYGPMLMISIMYIFGQMGGVSGILTFPLVNVLAKSGAEVRLRCSTNLAVPVYWRRRLHGASETQVLYYGDLGFSSSVNGRFKIDQSRDKGSYDVIVKNVTAKDAGVYICQDDGGMGDRKEMELVIFEYFDCTMPMPPVGFMGGNDIADDEIRATCSLKYHGNQKPRFYWRWNVNSVVNSTERVSGSTMINSTVTTLPREELNGAKLTCTATVSDGSDAEDSSAAVQWTSPQVTVLHASLQPGNVEQCTGSSVILVCNSECEYLEAQLNHDGLCQCVATYKRIEDQREFAFSVYSCAGSSSKTSFYILIVGVTVVIVISAIAAIAFLLRKYKGKRNPEDKKEKPETNGSPTSSKKSDLSESSGQNIPEDVRPFL